MLIFLIWILISSIFILIFITYWLIICTKEEGKMDISKVRCPECQKPMRLARAHCPDCDVSLEGELEVSALARLSLENQLFVVAFLRSHGSIKKMEGLFGISYPTVKNRLGAIISQLDQTFEAPTKNSAVLAQLAAGEISVEDALRRIR